MIVSCRMWRLSRRFEIRARLVGLTAAVVALAGQIAIGAVVPQVAATPSQLAALAAVSFICHAHGNAGDDQKPMPGHHAPELTLFPLSEDLTQFGALLSPPLVFLAPPGAQAVRVSFVPPARAPPSCFFGSAYARGPPFLI